jgi:hypothetical protein
MKKIMWMVALAGVMAMTGSVYAGSGCCPASGAKKSAKKEWSGCTSALSGIELTAEQQTQVDAYKAECEAAGMTKDACSSSMSKIRDVLTDEQKAKFDAASGSSAKKSSWGGCGS